MSFGRDTNIGRVVAEDASTILVRLEALLSAGITTIPRASSGENLADLLGAMESLLVELQRVRLVGELTLGEQVEETD